MTEPLHQNSGRVALAALLLSPGRTPNFDLVLQAAGIASGLLRIGLGAAFVERFLPADIAAELEAREDSMAIDRSSRIRGESRLVGLGTGPIYTAMGLEPDPECIPGVRVLQALILAALLIDSRFPGRVGSTAPTQIAQFLVGAFGNRREKTEVARPFIASLPSTLDLLEVRRKLSQASTHLPMTLADSLDRVVRMVLASIPAAPVSASTSEAAPVAPDEASSQRRTHVTRRPLARPRRRITSAEVISDSLPVFLVSGLRNPIARARLQEAEADAESPHEQAEDSRGIITEERDDLGFHARAARAKRVHLNLRHSAWARTQWDALTSGEMRAALADWASRAAQAIAQEDRLATEAALLVLLVGTLGWSDEQVWAVPVIRSDEPIPDGFDRAIYWDTGRVSFPIPEEGARYDPVRHGHTGFVAPVASKVHLRLPLEVSRFLGRWFGVHSRGWMEEPLEALRDHIRDIQRKGRADEPRETMARLRNGHLLQLLATQGDLPLAQIASGQFLGTTDVGLTYVARPQADIQNLYDAACEVHGLTPARAVCNDSPLVGGSRLQVSRGHVATIASQFRKGLGHPNGNCGLSAKESCKVHNSFVVSLAWQLVAATAARPNDSVGEITRKQLSVLGGCAVLADKESDEGHLGRLVPLPPLLCLSLTAYSRHLRSLGAKSGVDGAIAAATARAMSGDGPLLFSIKGTKPAPLVVADMKRKLAKTSPLPVNLFRHRYSSLLRAKPGHAPYVEALLGHVEYGVQPFGIESFMEPVAFLETMAGSTEAILREDGWRPMYGLSDADDLAWPVLPLGMQVLELRRNHTRMIEAIRAQRRADLDALRSLHEATVRDKVQEAIRTRAPSFFDAYNGNLNKDDVRAIRATLTDGAESIAEVQLSIEMFREAIESARADRRWKIAGSPYFFTSAVEPAPFATEYPAVYESLVAFRKHWILSLDAEQGDASTKAALHRATLCLILWHGVSDWPRLEAILRGLQHATPCAGLPGAIVVPCQRPGADEQAEILRDAVALAVAPLVGQTASTAEIDRSMLGRRIAARLPKHLYQSGAGRECIDVLLEAAAIAHHFESPGPVRAVHCGDQSSAGLPARRVLRLLSRSNVSLVNVESHALTTARDEAVAPARVSGRAAEAYRRLRNVLRVRGNKPKHLPYQNRVVERPFTDKQVREHIQQELELHRASFPDDGTVSCLLGQYASHILEHGTATSPHIEAQTVYGYVVGAGGALVRVHPEARLADWDSDDVLDIYVDALDAVKKRYRPFVARYLGYFHAYLVNTQGASPVDLRWLGGNAAGPPDVQVVTPREFDAACRFLASADDAAAIGSTTTCRQTEAVLALGYATGARSSELVLRQQRELVIEPGRNALIIRKNPFGRVKSNRANRVLSLEGWLSAPRMMRLLELATGMTTSGTLARRPLLPDADQPHLPVDMGTIQSMAGDALRAATGESDARLYALRHSAASLEFLFLFGDDALLDAIRAGCSADLPFPFGCSGSDFAILIGGSPVLSQIHAASYRSRRGHASMQTAIGSYIHVIQLILTHGIRQANAQLSAKAVAMMLGKSYAWVRQAMHRSQLPSTKGALFGPTLISRFFRPEERGKKGTPVGAPAPTPGKLRLTNVAECVRVYYQTGDSDEATARLQATRQTLEHARSHLASLRLRPKRADNRSLIAGALFVDATTASPTVLDVGERTIDPGLMRGCLERMRSADLDRGPIPAFWLWVLARLSMEDRVIRVLDERELECAFRHCVEALPDQDTGQLVLVHDRTIHGDDARAQLSSLGWATGIPAVPGDVRRPGFARVAATFRTKGGQVRLGTMAVLAACWSLWVSLRRA